MVRLLRAQRICGTSDRVSRNLDQWTTFALLWSPTYSLPGLRGSRASVAGWAREQLQHAVGLSEPQVVGKGSPKPRGGGL